MDALVIVDSLFVLGVAAHMDYKTRQVPDVLAICLWVLALAFVPAEAFLMASAFTIVWFINDVHFRALKKPMIGWGDALVIPPFFAIVDSAFGSAGMAAAVFFTALGVISSGVKKENERGEPIVAWLFVSILILAIASLIIAAVQFA